MSRDREDTAPGCPHTGTAPKLPNSLPLTMPTGSSSGRGAMSLEDLLNADHVNESCVLDIPPRTIMDG